MNEHKAPESHHRLRFVAILSWLVIAGMVEFISPDRLLSVLCVCIGTTAWAPYTTRGYVIFLIVLAISFAAATYWVRL